MAGDIGATAETVAIEAADAEIGATVVPATTATRQAYAGPAPADPGRVLRAVHPFPPTLGRTVRKPGSMHRRPPEAADFFSRNRDGKTGQKV